jgi:hypothetical protein
MTTEVLKADESDWISDFAEKKENEKGGDKKKNVWMKFDHPGEYQIRLVGKAVKFNKYFKPFGKGTRVISHKNYKDEDPAWQAGFYPNETFAIHVIDRADGVLKIMEKGKGLFKHFADYQRVNEINPAGKGGPDWVIKVEWPNGDKQLAKYTATAKAKPSPFTEAEIEMIKEGMAPLKTIYQTTSLEKIKELWNALPDAAKIPPPKKEYKDYNKTASSDTTVAAPTVAKAQPKIVEPTSEPVEADGDDLFGDEKTDSPF